LFYCAKDNLEYSDFPLAIINIKKSAFFVFLNDNQYIVERVSKKCIPHNSSLGVLYNKKDHLEKLGLPEEIIIILRDYLSLEKF